MGADDKSCGLAFSCNIYCGDLPVESPPDQALSVRVELYYEHGPGVLLIAAAAKASCYLPPEPRLNRSGNFV